MSKKIDVKTEKKKNPREYIKFVMIAGVLILLMALMILFTVFTVTNSLEKEQMLTLETVSGKITSSISSYFDSHWEKVDSMAETMEFESYATAEDALKMLGRIQKAHGLEETNNLLLLMDDKGYYYTPAAGKVALWQSFSSTMGTLRENETVMLGDLAELRDHQERYICFVKQLEKPIITADGKTFPYIVMATDESVFDIDLSLGDFGTVADAFVMANNGRKVNNQGGTLDISHSHNLLAALKNADFVKGDSYDQMIEAIQKDESGVSLVRYLGNEYYISYHSLGVQDWNAVFIVETSRMTDRISPTVYRLFLVLILGFSILTTTIILIIIRRYKERRQNDKLRAATQIAEQSNKAKSDFMSRMSHDIRTPLSGIISWTEIARGGMEARDCEAVSECMDNITESSNYLLDLVNEILDMSQVEHGNMKVKNSPLHLNHFLDSTTRMMQGRIAKEELTLQTDFSGIDHPNVIADGRILNHILLNILGNAVKYTKPGGRIHFTAYDTLLSDESAAYHFVISDTGIGMSQEFVEHIFDRFAQEDWDDKEEEDSARTRYTGVGLGMAITKELVDLLGGQITVESQKDVGSTFEVILTLSICAAEEQPAEDGNHTETALRQYHILLAEDVPMNRKAMTRLFERAGLICDAVEDGCQAVEAFEQSKLGEYDAILMDIMMPNMNGRSATRAIRAMSRPDARSIPVFALSANALPEDIQKSVDAGMDLHLSKPLVINEVLKALNTWCTKEE